MQITRAPDAVVARHDTFLYSVCGRIRRTVATTGIGSDSVSRMSLQSKKKFRNNITSKSYSGDCLKKDTCITVDGLDLLDLLVGAGVLGVERGVALLRHGAAPHGVAAERAAPAAAAAAALAARLAAAAAAATPVRWKRAFSIGQKSTEWKHFHSDYSNIY